jgi:hypothetical protein
MPSTALQTWSTTRAASLDDIERAHAAVGGSGRGHRTVWTSGQMCWPWTPGIGFGMTCW